MGETCWTEAMTSFCLLLFITSPILGLPSGEVQAQQANGTGPEKATDCDHFLCIRDGSSSNSIYPWLINNRNARFAYVRTDSEGYATYSYTRSYNGQTLTYYLHFYDEGLIYNSENDYCPKDTADYWYIWDGGDWQYNTNIYL